MAAGSTFPVTITVENSDYFGIDGAVAFINFDPEYLEVVDVTGTATDTIEAGSTMPMVLLSEVYNDIGIIEFVAGRPLRSTSETEDFVLATVSFKLKAALPVRGTEIKFDDDDPSVSITDAFVQGGSVLGALNTCTVTGSPVQIPDAPTLSSPANNTVTSTNALTLT